MKLTTLLQARRVFLEHSNDKMPASLAYKFMKAIKASDNEDAFYSEKLKNIIDTYGLRDESGNIVPNKNGSVNVQPEKIDECNAKVKELEDTEVDAPTVHFSIEELGDLEFTVKELFLLDEYIK